MGSLHFILIMKSSEVDSWYNILDSWISRYQDLRNDPSAQSFWFDKSIRFKLNTLKTFTYIYIRCIHAFTYILWAIMLFTYHLQNTVDESDTRSISSIVASTLPQRSFPNKFLLTLLYFFPLLFSPFWSLRLPSYVWFYIDESLIFKKSFSFLCRYSISFIFIMHLDFPTFSFFDILFSSINVLYTFCSFQSFVDNFCSSFSYNFFFAISTFDDAALLHHLSFPHSRFYFSFLRSFLNKFFLVTFFCRSSLFYCCIIPLIAMLR